MISLECRSVSARHEQQYAVVLARLAERPGPEEPVGVRLDGLAVETFDGRDDDLVGGSALESRQLLGQRGFRCRIDDAGPVDDPAGQRRKLGPSAAAASASAVKPANIAASHARRDRDREAKPPLESSPMRRRETMACRRGARIGFDLFTPGRP